MTGLYEKLKEKLISLELKPGDKLSENFIASEEGIGRPRVRQVLAGLSDEGYLNTLPQKGSVVTLIKRDLIREATHVHMVLEQSIFSELIEKRKAGEELYIINDYVNMLRGIKKPKSEYEMVKLEWGFFNTLAKSCNREYAYSFLERLDCDMYRLSSLKYATYNYSVYNSALNAWENTLVEIKLMADQLNNCQIELLTMLCSNRYKGFLVTADALCGIYNEYFESK